MAHDTITISRKASLIEAISCLEDCKSILTLIVTEDDSRDSRVVGTLSDGDIRRWFIERFKSDSMPTSQIQEATVSDAMNRAPIKIVNSRDSWFDKIQEARECEDRHIRIIPIVDADGHLIDILDLVATKRRPRLEAILMAKARLVGNEYSPCLTREAIMERRKNYDTHRIQYQISKYEALAKLTRIEMMSILKHDRIDELYMAFKRGSDWAIGFQSPNDRIKKRLEDLARTLDQAKNSLILLYLTEMGNSSESYLGDQTAAEHPDLLFVLGCATNQEQQARVKEAKNLLLRLKQKGALPRAVVLSGGGTDACKTEAAMMKLFMMKKEPEISDLFYSKRPDRPKLILEEDSLDTVGNAVFSKLLLLQRQMLSDPPKPICVVTSDYHAQRTLDLFARLFKPEKIAVWMSLTDGNIEKKAQRAIKQLDSEYRANFETFGLENVVTGLPDSLAQAEVQSVFFQLLRHHDLYKHRADLIRKYQDVLNLAKVSDSP